MKKLFFFGLIVVPAVMTALLWVLITNGFSCLEDTSDVSVTVTKITLSEASRTSSNVDVQVQIKNDGVSKALLEKMQYNIYAGYQNKWYWIGRAEKTALEVGADDVANFTVTTNIDNSQLVDVVTGSFFGGNASEMKIAGSAMFTIGTDTLEVEFEKIDPEPYKPVLEDEGSATEPIEAGTEGAISD